MKLISSVFKDGQLIPNRYTGEGLDEAVPLNWTDVPAGAKSLALVCDDPDAPKSAGNEHPFVHWLVYNIPPTVSSLPAGLNKVTQGRNSFGKIGYGGPMPPRGHGPHHYIFTLYALDTDLKLEEGLSKTEFMRAIDGHVISKARIIGVFERGTVRKTA